VNGGFVILLLLLFAVFYFLMIRPQRQRQAKHQSLIDSVGVGEDVLTTGGIYGTITQVEGDDLVVEIADGVEVHMTRRGVAAVLPPEEEEDDEEDEEAADDEGDIEPAGELEEAAVTSGEESVTSASGRDSSSDDES
jgi:preprotein translocase subunit YajC